MFKKLFGGNDKKPAPAPAQPAPQKTKQQNQEEIDIQFEKQIYEINLKVDDFDKKIESSQNRLEKLDKEIKTLIQEKKKQQAKTKITEAKQVKTMIEEMEKKKIVFMNMKLNLELSKENASSGSLIKGVNNLMKNQEKVNEDLSDQMADWQDYLNQEKEARDLWSQMAEIGVDKGEIDDEYAQYEKELNEEEAQKVQNQFAGIPNANIQKPSNVQPQKKEDKFMSAMEDALNI